MQHQHAAVHAVLAVGFACLRDEVAADGYAELAASYSATSEEKAYASALRRRTRRQHLDRDGE